MRNNRFFDDFFFGVFNQMLSGKLSSSVTFNGSGNMVDGTFYSNHQGVFSLTVGVTPWSRVTIYLDGKPIASNRWVRGKQGTFNFPNITELSQGEHKIEVVSRSMMTGKTTKHTTTFVHDTIPPTGSIDVIRAGDGLVMDGTKTTDPNVIVQGKGEVGALVKVYDGTTLVGNTQVNKDGSWSLKINALGLGEHNFKAAFQDRAGNTGQTKPYKIILVEDSSQININPHIILDDGSAINEAGTTITDDTVIITGKAPPGAQVTITDKGKHLGQVTAKADGTWEFATPRLTDGNHDLNVQIILADGSNKETSNFSFRVDTTSTTQPDHAWSRMSGWGFADALKAYNLVNKSSLSNNDTNSGRYSKALKDSNVNDLHHYGLTGKGITVAIIDTGIDTKNIDFSGKIHHKSWNFVGNNSDVHDTDGHGTAVASIIGAANNNFGLTGGAYDASLMVLKVAEPDGSLSSEAIRKSIYYAVDNGAKVINMSLGGDSSLEYYFRDALEHARSKDVLVFAAAGNDGDDKPSAPAISAKSNGNVAAVGSASPHYGLSSFSSEAGSSKPYGFISANGDKVDVYGLQSKIVQWSGTSFSSPVLATIAAALLSSDLNLTDDQVMRTIMNGSVAFG